MFLITRCKSCGGPHVPQNWGDDWCEDCMTLPRAGFTDWETDHVTARGYQAQPCFGTSWPVVHGRHVPVLFFPSIEQRDEALALLRGHFRQS